MDLDAAALAEVRFAISPVGTAAKALSLLRPDAPSGGGGWRARIQHTVRDRKLAVLGSLYKNAMDYVPDFITPQPDVPEPVLEDELHAIANVAADRLRWEFELMSTGLASERLRGCSIPVVLLDLLQRGERAVAEGLAAELDQLWRHAVAPHWTSLRARLEADIDHRSGIAARHGLSTMLTGLPQIIWNGDHLRVVSRIRGHIPGCERLVLAPSAFVTRLHVVADSIPAPAPRQPLIAYPAMPGPDAVGRPAAATPALLGVTRARILADLDSPRTTSELSERHFLTVGTVSYHLGIMYRSGVVTRTRSGNRVFYRRTPRASVLMCGES